MSDGTEPEDLCTYTVDEGVAVLRFNRPERLNGMTGACAGAGLAYALQCDLRFAAEGVKFTTAFSRRGLIAEYGMVWLLDSIVGRSNAMDLLLSARIILSDEALLMGLVNRVVPSDNLLDVALDYARDLAANVSPASMATIKHQFRVETSMSAEDALVHAEGLMRESLRGADVAEGIGSFLDRRPADFAPLGQGTRFGWMTRE